MTLIDGIILAVIAVVLGLAAGYIYRSKKKGKKCIGCPDGCACDCSKCAPCDCADQ